MNDFKSFGIRPAEKSYEGDKIKIDKVLNRQIKVHYFKIEPSKTGKGNCLYMQIEVDGAKRLLWTGSGNLIAMIQQVPKNGFPFNTTIVKENERLEFT